MSNFVLTATSTADMPLEFFQKRDIPFVKFHYIMDGNEYPDDLGQTMPFDEFYRRIEAGAMPTTSQVSVGQFIDFCEPFLQKGLDVIHIALSSGISGSYDSALTAREQLLEKYPNRQIFLVDSLGASSGYGLLVDMAADLRDKGVSATEIYTWLEQNKLKIHHWFFTSDLSHLKRGGRISGAAALMGTLLGICPLMNMSHIGKLVPRHKIRSKKKVIEETVRMMEIHAENGHDYSGKCFISQSACFEDARSVASLVEAKFPKLNGKVLINSIGTVIGSHTGPGTVALFFVGDPRED
jgi:DegV family protein with EDD domain